VSTKTPDGSFICIAVGGDPSLKPAVPVPATTLNIPVFKLTLWTKFAKNSLKNKFPFRSPNKPRDLNIAIDVAGPPLGDTLATTPVPAAVVMIPVTKLIVRRRLLPHSAKYNFPVESPNI
jgi:hypothetical protein